MIDMNVQHLLKQAVDTPTKLHLLLIFHENPRLETTPASMAERACRDMWSVSQALYELAEDGILQVVYTANELTYVYQPRPEYVEPIQLLMHSYNDPMERSKLRHSIRELSGYASSRRALQRAAS